jgi:carbonic anhydrase
MQNRALLCALTIGLYPFDGWSAEADIALDRLIKGNARYANGTPTHGNQSRKRRADLKAGEKPFAVVLSCSDSRVPPEVVFDQGLGDLYVVRVAGNVMNDSVLGSIEYAVENLGASLLVVLGHEECSAVKAAMVGVHAGNHIQALNEALKPAVAAANGVVHAAVIANVRNVVRQLSEAGPDLQPAVQKGRLKIVGAQYHFATGNVEILR